MDDPARTQHPTGTPHATRTARIDEARAHLAEAREQFGAGAGYLAACTLGIPTRGTRAAMNDDLDTWALGRVDARAYDESVRSARESFARLVGVPASRVSVGSQASVSIGMIAASLPDRAEVLCVDGDFSSAVFPFLAQAGRGVTVRHAPLAQLADAIRPTTTLVSFSAVQSATGEIASLERIVAAARAHGAATLCDTTQATGWLPIDASLFDTTVCHSYKWLCAPRGASFLTVSEEFAERLVPVHAGWYAGEEVWGSCYGPVMQLASDARRFDVSPAWPVWVGAAAALRFFAGLDGEAVRAHNSALGNALCAGLGIEARDQAIVTWPDAAGEGLRRLAAAGLTASGRAGRARVAFHLWNTMDDVERVLEAVA
ncbi:aminotransferase class V-fold PLP-dependent enzyme [Compostimonas suwonensis]|uniref:Selenocysteine lyase/cysteine desulfurase n=1 Tax=Compostimonas suwonensis TaxID=1048394 RepID=A0A2M9BBC4_9MICO|nr:aminotransferase class V-fold PLP-dependent enzyme [Compostimonas suwonensis]PJJ55245.1 selenocysteine lyase/cysteine desulfurase [Compostimonas suwonensis]